MVSVDPCRLCGNDRYKVVDQVSQTTRRFTIARCCDCGLVYVREIYDEISPDYVHLANSDIDTSRIWLQGRHKEPAFRQFIKAIKQFRPQWITGMLQPKLLDVVCGTGGFLAFISEFFTVYGFDASAAQAEYARKMFPEVRRATSATEYVALLGCPQMKFDVITLWDVLEHIRRPMEFLNDLVDYLDQGGLIYISTPNANTMVIKSILARFYYPGFDWAPQEHIAYYSPSTLRFLFGKLGLRVLQIGSTAVYPRPFSAFEVFRRVGFAVTAWFPKLAPQIYAFAERL